MASIKGKLFEFFVFRLLVSCGFKPVDPDELLVYRETDNNGCPINCPDRENFPNCYCQPDTLED